MELGNGTVAVVTGAASGIGLALAEAFAAQAARSCSPMCRTMHSRAAEQRIAASGIDMLAVRHRRQQGRAGRSVGDADDRTLRARQRAVQQRRRSGRRRPVVRRDRVMGVGDRRQLLGRRSTAFAPSSPTSSPPDRRTSSTRRRSPVCIPGSRRRTTPASTPWSPSPRASTTRCGPSDSRRRELPLPGLGAHRDHRLQAQLAERARDAAHARRRRRDRQEPCRAGDRRRACNRQRSPTS